MQIFDSEYFGYKNNELYCEGVSVKSITDALGTPAYIYSKKFFGDKYNEFKDAFKNVNNTLFFATKSNFNLNVIKIFSNLGSGIDVNSGGELFRALKAGFQPDKIIMSGVGKTDEEIKLAIENNILMLKAESLEEIHVIDEIARSLNKTASIAIRVNPDVDAKTHPYISTGLAENKFGISSKEAISIFVEASKLKNIKLAGIDMHIGSQIVSVEPFKEAVEKLAQFVLTLRENGVNVEHLDMGGGVGVRYKDENPFPISQLAEAIVPIVKKLNVDLFFEPGRFLTANAGVLIAKVLYTKQNGNKNFIVVDTAMTDLLRPSIYGAYHHIQPVSLNAERKDIIADIVGPVCESGDFLAKKREISKCKRGDLLSVMSAGAYGMAMASNYNMRRRPPEIIVDGDKYFVVRSRENYEHMLFDEKIML
jgi:diaminopimelate decarboxylase